MSKSIKKNFVFNLGYQILLVVLPLVTTPHVAAALQENAIGAYGFSQSIVTYFIMFGCIGLALYGQREIAFHQSNDRERSKVFWELIILKCISMSISIIVYLFTIQYLPEYKYVLYIQLIDLIANMIDVTFLFQGMEEFKTIVTRNTIIRILGIIAIFTLVKTPQDLLIYTGIYSVSLLVGNLSLWVSVPKFIVKVPIKELNFKKHFRPALVLFLPQIAISIYTVLNTTMLGFMSTNADVAYFTQAQKIIRLALTLVTSLSTVMLPRVANLFADKDYEKINQFTNVSLKFTYLIGTAIVFGLIGISANLIPWFLGAGFEQSQYILMMLAPQIVIIGTSNVIGIQYLLPTKRQKAYTISAIVGSIVNFALNLVLIPQFSAIGAACASVIAELSVTMFQLYSVRKEFKLTQVLKGSIKYLISGLLMLGTLLLLNRVLSPGMINTVIMVAVGGGVYFLLLIIMKEQLVIDTLKSVLKR